MRITAIHPDHLDEVWPYIRDMLEGATDTAGTKFDVDDVLVQAKQNVYVVWGILDENNGDEVVAAFTTRLIVYPKRKALAIDWLGGKRMREWIDDMNDLMMRYAKDLGCQHLEGYGRKAWGRWLGKRGWNPAYTCYEAEVV